MIIQKNKKYYLIPKPKTLYGMKCFACREKVATQVHHCLSGRADRKKCEEDGLTVGLCNDCHWIVHNNTNTGLYHKLKRIAQIVYEKTHTRQEWMNRYHRNYRWVEEKKNERV